MSTVDLSGVLAALRERYRSVLAAYRRAATGDPAALRAAGSGHATRADRLGQVADAVRDTALVDDWTGPAADAYRRAGGVSADRLGDTATLLRSQRDVLDGAADALIRAAAGIDALGAGFERDFGALIARCGAVPAGQCAAVLAVARSVGETYLTAAGSVTTALRSRLADLGSAAPAAIHQ
ncbi:hypothetical protein Athai_11310 [Actinocatenispora thailandica]|uniref:Uncharacterized protein n=1 Tax=Actinocatenispora thailandica TaxID=227318 RepID=A0A7R7DL57_9ACTN|nr:hypothetical protein [Actinocatenispora thailandica]BCJ33628.1 hypothetical protein Athai_11310 [Actinocatenispora thailandica]